MTADLNNHIGFRDVQGGVADLTEAKTAMLPRGLESGQKLTSVVLLGASVDIRDRALGGGESFAVQHQRGHVVTEDDNLVATVGVIVHEPLARTELAGVERVQQALQAGVAAKTATNVFRIKLLGHRAPHFHALHTRQVAIVGEIDPVGFVQLGPHKEAQIFDLVVLAHQRRGEAELAVGIDKMHDFLKHVSRRHVHLVEDHQPPLAPAHSLDHHLAGLGAPAAVADHAVGGDDHAGLAGRRQGLLHATGKQLYTIGL